MVVNKAGRVVVLGNLESSGRHSEPMAAWCVEENGRGKGSRGAQSMDP